MPGSAAVVEALNEILTAELTAINQYFVHSKLCESWGFGALAAHNRAESIDEMRHAEALVERVLYFDGFPNLQRLNPLRVGESVEEQFRNDLDLEYVAVERLNNGIAAAVAAGDNGTRHLLEEILVSEEEHIDWLETQLEAIGQVGIQQYLAEQLS